MIALMSTARGFVRHVLLLSLLFAGVPAHTARAADARAADNGWFDPQTPSGAASAPAAPATPPPPPAADSKPVPGDGRDLPSLAPSPLLEDRGSQSQQASSQQAPDPEETNPRALSEFRTQLDPYGTWVQHPTYGTIWVPSSSVVGTGFSPYVSSGHWALDDDGNWIWVSDFSFGRVVFHYGRWVWVGGTGWAWVPGYRYAPAWVSWRVPTGSYAYVGWAPLGPSYLWFNGFAVSYWYGAYTPWVYCPSAYVFHHSVNYYVVRDRVLVDRLAYNTRVYTPASVRGVSARSSLSVVSPSLSAARVPSHAVPAERIHASTQMAGAVPSGRADRFSGASRIDRARPDFSRPDSADRFRSTDRFHSSPSTSTDRFRSAPASPERFRSAPSPSFTPRQSSTPSRSFDSFSRSRPSFSESRPSFSSPRPSFSSPRPSFSSPRPSFSSPRPSFGGGGSRPSFGGGSHSFGGSRGGGHGRR